MLSSEMTLGMSHIGVPYSTHATFNSVCERVEAEAHKNFNSRQVHCCCCMRAAYYMEDWMDHLEDETLFGCSFETGGNSHELSLAHTGVATVTYARNDKPRCLCGNGSYTNSLNYDKLQADHRCENSICKLRLDVSQLSSGSGQSTSSCGETEVCLDITQENIRLKQEDDTVLNHSLQWKRDDLKSKKISNDQELIQSDPISCPQNQKGNN